MEKKKFLFVSLEALSADLAWHVKKEGHDVRFSTKSREDISVGNGFFTKVSNWREWTDWADVIVFDDVLGQGHEANKLRRMGKRVVGGTPYTDRLEDDR